MSKKWKIVLAVVAAVVVISLAGAAVALAADGDEPATTSNPLLSGVAQILGNGMTEQQVADALKQARQEVAGAAITKAIDNAVTNNVITQADAEAIKAWLAQQPDPADKAAIKTWWEARPEISNPKVYDRFLGARRLVMRFGYCFAYRATLSTPVMEKAASILGVSTDALVNAFKQAAQELQSTRLQNALGNAVKNGKLTQDEANQIQQWWSQRPPALDKLGPGPGFGFGRMGGCWGQRVAP